MEDQKTRLTHLPPLLIPAWAGLCGVLASGSFQWHDGEWLLLGLLVVLIQGGWGTLWATLAHTDWATPIRRWREWRSGEPVPAPPYTQPRSPGADLARWLGQLQTWWRDILWPACGRSLSSMAAALLVVIVLSVHLGPYIVLLSITALTLMQLALATRRGESPISPLWDGAISFILPWLAGHLVFAPLTLGSAAMATAFTLAWAASRRTESRWGRASALSSQLVAAALLVVLHHPLAAMGTSLLVVPQLALLPWLHATRNTAWYSRHTQPWLLLMMLAAAWAM